MGLEYATTEEILLELQNRFDGIYICLNKGGVQKYLFTGDFEVKIDCYDGNSWRCNVVFENVSTFEDCGIRSWARHIERVVKEIPPDYSDRC